MRDVREQPLETFLERITYGFTSPMPTVDDGPFMITARDVNDGRVLYDQARRTSFSAYSALTEKSRPKIGDVLVTKDGTLGRLAVVDRADTCVNQSVAVLRPNSHIKTRFLKYLLEEPQVHARMLADADGSTIKHIYISRLGRMLVRVPPLVVQDKVLSILTPLDDKIELNRQMNETLETMAQAIFRDWFVHFGPTRRKLEGAIDPVEIMGGLVKDAERAQQLADLFPSSLDDNGLPAGWRNSDLREIAEVHMGASPKGDSYNDVGDGTPLVNGPVEFGQYFVKRSKWTTAPTRMSERGDFIVCVRGSTTGRYVFSDDRYCLGRGVAAIRAKGDLQEFVNATVITNMDRLLQKTTGSVFPNLSGEDIRRFICLVPPLAIRREYTLLSRPLRERVWHDVNENESLAATRDLLLPKLMSGEIELRDVEDQLEAAQ